MLSQINQINYNELSLGLLHIAAKLWFTVNTEGLYIYIKKCNYLKHKYPRKIILSPYLIKYLLLIKISKISLLMTFWYPVVETVLQFPGYRTK